MFNSKISQKQRKAPIKNTSKSQASVFITFFKYISLILILQVLVFRLQNNYKNKKSKEIWQSKTSKLQQDPTFRRLFDLKNASEEACNKGEVELRDYYLGNGTLDLSEINLENDTDSVSEPVQVIVDLVDGAGFSMDKGITYGKHIIISVAALVLALLTLIFWPLCCFCCCCNCCCCCCCKKKCCKFPCFIITMVMYATIAACCVYGFSQSNNLFTGLSSMVCAVLKFSGEVLDGETKDTVPKWAGVGGLQDSFDELKQIIGRIKNQSYDDMLANEANYEQAKDNMDTFFNDYADNEDDAEYNPKKYGYDCIGNSEMCIYNLSLLYGPKDQEVTFLYTLDQKYNATVAAGDDYINTASARFSSILGNSSDVEKILTDANKKIGDLKSTVDKFSGMVSKNIYNYSKLIDEYGKLAFKVCFAAILIINVFSALLLIFYIIVSCNGCLACFVRLFINVSWNLFIILSFLSFLLAFIFTLIGTVGKDAVDLVQYILGQTNLMSNSSKIITGEGKDYLKICLYDGGDLSSKLNFIDKNNSQSNSSNPMTSLQELNDMKDKIDNATATLEASKLQFNAFDIWTQMLNDSCDFRVDFSSMYIAVTGDGVDSEEIKLRDKYLVDMNRCLSGQQYSFVEEEGKTLLNLDVIENFENSGYDYSGCSSPFSCTEATEVCVKKHYFHIIKSILIAKNNICNKVEPVEDGNTHGLLYYYSRGQNKYDKVINSEIKTLDSFGEAIENLTSVFDQYLGEDSDLFSIVNCAFIGNNTKILLKYFKEGIGSGFFNVGIALFLCSLAMITSISLTLLSISIIKKLAEEQEKENEKRGKKKNKGPQKYKPRGSIRNSEGELIMSSKK